MKKIKKVIATLLSLIIVVVSCPAQIFAADSITIDNKTHDYADIKSLPYEFSYGTLFWTANTSVEPIQYNSKYFKENYRHSVTYGACVGDTIKLKINNCSIDKDGDMCDVFITVKDIKAFSKYTVNNKFGPDFGESTSDPANCRIEIAITQLDSNFGDLIYFWFNTNAASASFNMQYVKDETNNPANIDYNVSTFFDFDVPSVKNKGLEGEYYEGNEGISVPSSTVYYDKSNSTGYLTDAKNLPSGYNIGVCTPSYSTIPVNSNSPEKQTSCVVIQQLDNSLFKMHYSGRSCGVAWVFISPYSYDTANPNISVDVEEVFEGETFNYTISQYVPNNYYAETLQFIDGVGGHYSSFEIRNKLSDKLTINGDITVQNESGTDVTSYFDISTDSNYVVARLKSQYFSDKNFYSHLYSVNVPVFINSGTGLSQSHVSNSAETVFENSIESKELETSNVDVGLKYKVNIISTIDHGNTYINSNEPSASDTITNTVSHGGDNVNTVYFTVANEYNLKSVKIDGETVDNDTLTKTGNVYSYTFNDKNISENIQHNVDVITEIKESMVTVEYVDDSGAKLNDDVIINGKVFDRYTTDAKNFYGYELTEKPDNASGNMTVDPITVRYVYTLKDAKVIVKYVDDTGKELSASETINGKVFDKYSTLEKTFYGYRLISNPVNASGVMTEDDITVTYTYTKKQASVTANYITEDNTVISDPVTTSGNVGDSYETIEKDIYGYELVEVSGNVSGVYTEDNISVNYIYQLKSASITVNYITDTGIVLDSPIIINGKVFDVYNTDNKQFTGYELIAVPDNASGTMSEEPIIVNYVYRLKSASVVVNYITDEGKSLAEPVTIVGKVFDEYSSENKSFYGYALTEMPDNASGQMTETQIVVNYIYQLKTSYVTVHYIDKNGNEIDESVTINGKVFDKYETNSKSIYGYTLTAVPDNAEGEMTEEPIVVNYVYQLRDSSVVVHYITEDGDALCDDVIINGKVFENYKTEKKAFYGYTLMKMPDNNKGKMTEDQIEVTYVYSLNSSSVVVNYITDEGKSLAEPVTIVGKVFDEYSSENKSFYGYELIVMPDNASGVMTDGQTIVDYVYRLKNTSVNVNYVTDTGEKLADSITISGKVFDNYNTEEKSFYGYSLIAVPSNASGTMTEDTIVVDYVYKLKSTSVKINYVDDNGLPLSDSKIINGKVFDKYETEQKDIYGYTLTAVPDNAEGVMTEDIITVNYVYKLNDAFVYVDYLTDKGVKLHDTVTIKGKVFDKYNTEEKSFYGYYLSSTTDNITGLMQDKPISVIYTYMLKNAVVTANYVTDTGEKLADSVTINGKVFDDYKTEAKTLYGYNLVSLPENANGIMTENDITVDYVYTLKDASVIVNYMDDSGNKIADSETINGKVFDEYKTDSKVIYGYELADKPSNASGEMTEDTIVVNYVYNLKDAEVIVNYISEDGDNLTDSVKISGKVFDEYTTEQKSFYGYDFVSASDNISGKMTEDTIVVDYIYAIKDTSVIVNYVDAAGNKIADSETINGKVFDEYNTIAKEIKGYEYFSVEGNPTGTMTEETIEINFIYKIVEEEKNPTPVIENNIQTGDNNRVMMYVTMALIAIVFIIAMIFVRKKYNG